jgi:hypothetical protein
VQHLSAARDAVVELIQQQPGAQRLLAALADCCESLAHLHRAGGNDEAAKQAAAQAVDVRRRLTERRQDVATRLDLLGSYFNLPIEAALEAQSSLSQKLIDEWPSDAAGIYEAACHLTRRTPVLNAPQESDESTP